MAKYLPWVCLSCGMVFGFGLGYTTHTKEPQQPPSDPSKITVDLSGEVHLIKGLNQPHIVLRPVRIKRPGQPNEILSSDQGEWLLTFAVTEDDQPRRVVVTCSDVK